MERTKLGGSDLEVSRMGLGMWQAAGDLWGEDVRDEDCIAAMVRAHELGVNLVDTAEAYGNGHSEEVVGRALQKVDRDEVVVATKVGGSHLRYEHVLKACELSRERLGVNAIDLYQVHWPDPWQQVPLSETMHALERLQKEGQIHAIGVSNFAVRDLEEARAAISTTDIVSNQVQYSLLHREPEKEVLPYCRREGITVLAWSPLAKGALTGRYDVSHRPGDRLREDHVLFRTKNMESTAPLVAVLGEIAEAHDASLPQVALNWLLAQDGVIPIPGAKRPIHVEGNVGALRWTLSESERTRIRDAAEAVTIDPF